MAQKRETMTTTPDEPNNKRQRDISCRPDAGPPDSHPQWEKSKYRSGIYRADSPCSEETESSLRTLSVSWSRLSDMAKIHASAFSGPAIPANVIREDFATVGCMECEGWRKDVRTF
jgi:hypothetical protein